MSGDGGAPSTSLADVVAAAVVAAEVDGPLIVFELNYLGQCNARLCA